MVVLTTFPQFAHAYSRHAQLIIQLHKNQHDLVSFSFNLPLNHTPATAEVNRTINVVEEVLRDRRHLNQRGKWDRRNSLLWFGRRKTIVRELNSDTVVCWIFKGSVIMRSVNWRQRWCKCVEIIDFAELGILRES